MNRQVQVSLCVVASLSVISLMSVSFRKKLKVYWVLYLMHKSEGKVRSWSEDSKDGKMTR